MHYTIKPSKWLCGKVKHTDLTDGLCIHSRMVKGYICTLQEMRRNFVIIKGELDLIARQKARPGSLSYCGLDPAEVKNRMKGDIFVDLRNVYEPDIMKKNGFEYICAGR